MQEPEKRKKKLVKRYIKRAACRRYRGRRILKAGFLLGAFFYFTVVWNLKDMLFHISEENIVEFRRVGEERREDTFLQELYRITFRFKQGEIVFDHERAEYAEEP